MWILRYFRRSEPPYEVARTLKKRAARRVLNVGGGSKTTPISSHYDGWEHSLLDIDPRGAPDIVCDARQLESLTANQFDAIYCSHNLEHYYRHDVFKVLRGFIHVLAPDGFAEIRVPDVKAVMRRVVDTDMDIGDVLYNSASGAITAHDVIYGWGKEIEASGQNYYAHKTGFTPQSLEQTLGQAGFRRTIIFIVPDAFELRAFSFKSVPNDFHRSLLRLPA